MATKNHQPAMTKASAAKRLQGSIAELLAAVQIKGAEEAPTTHPIKSVDDNTSAATTGSRGAEYEKDIKEQQGTMSVDSAPPATDGDGKAEAIHADQNVGPIQAQSTGKDPAVEDDFKDKKDDPGSEHPARTDNEALDGKKYASEFDYFKALAKQSEKIGAALLAQVASELQPTQKQTPTASAKAASETPAAAEAAEKAAQDGYDLAGVFADYAVSATDKAACDQLVYQQVAQLVKLASDDADRYAEFLAGNIAQRTKAANDEAALAEMQEGAGHEAAEAAGGGEEAPAAAAPGDQNMPSEEELMMLLSQMSGGQAPPAEEAPPEAAAAGGGDDVALLQQVLAELGANPQEVKAAFERRLGEKQAAAKPLSRQQSAKKAAMARMVKDMVATRR